MTDTQFKVYLTILQPGLQAEVIAEPEDWRPSIAENANFYLNTDPQFPNQQLYSMEHLNY